MAQVRDAIYGTAAHTLASEDAHRPIQSSLAPARMTYEKASALRWLPRVSRQARLSGHNDARRTHSRQYAANADFHCKAVYPTWGTRWGYHCDNDAKIVVQQSSHFMLRAGGDFGFCGLSPGWQICSASKTRDRRFGPASRTTRSS